MFCVMYKNEHHGFWHVWLLECPEEEVKRESEMCDRAFFYCDTEIKVVPTSALKSRRPGPRRPARRRALCLAGGIGKATPVRSW